MFKVSVKTQHYINISILLGQHVSVLLDHLQANIKRYEVQSVHNTYSGIQHCIQDVHKDSLVHAYVYNQILICQMCD